MLNQTIPMTCCSRIAAKDSVITEVPTMSAILNHNDVDIMGSNVLMNTLNHVASVTTVKTDSIKMDAICGIIYERVHFNAIFYSYMN